ncbi:GNAT family N-acetyltransferase [Oceanirhabdus sp. W0125-5]|uniref:GNAT family N-acetyltransferase n=1 Tax=Oceanirhabdus sp. W0125-5 TaxID=2999116 RepID=UPI0022F2E567|nr:GNAT family N-acetyltransferase [Oceanirhabdus sp. W0125-5]WBW97817.1 GNAT family N-acetyltransferase [Oceanirhabdus sp. W0125-5]
MDNIKLLENKLTTEQFCNLQKAVGFGRPNPIQTEKAIENSIYSVSISIGGEVIGMGRLVGDGARIFYIQDVCIAPKFQGKGIGKLVVQKLLAYIKNNSIENSTVTIGLMAAKGKEGFYEKLGFLIRPNEKLGNGMIMKIKI